MVIIDRPFLDEREVREVLSYMLPSHHVFCVGKKNGSALGKSFKSEKR